MGVGGAFCLSAPSAGRPSRAWIEPRERNHGANYFDFILLGILKVKSILNGYTASWAKNKALEFVSKHDHYVWMIHLLIPQVSEAERNVQSQVQTMVSRGILFSQKSVILITCFHVLSGILLYKLSEQHTVDCHQPPELHEKKMNASVSWWLIRKHGRINVFILPFEIKCNCFKKIIMVLFELYAFLMKH